MERKQTAVDYLFEMWLQDKTITQSALERAKAIEEKEVKRAYADGQRSTEFKYPLDAQQYYNEMYNSEQS